RNGVRACRRLGPRGGRGARRAPRLGAHSRARAGRRVPPVPTRCRRLQPVSVTTPSEREARRRPHRRHEIPRWTFPIPLVLAVFPLGIALGEALHDNPRPGGTMTLERTFSIPSVPPGSTAVP